MEEALQQRAGRRIEEIGGSGVVLHGVVLRSAHQHIRAGDRDGEAKKIAGAGCRVEEGPKKRARRRVEHIDGTCVFRAGVGVRCAHENGPAQSRHRGAEALADRRARTDERSEERSRGTIEEIGRAEASHRRLIQILWSTNETFAPTAASDRPK